MKNILFAFCLLIATGVSAQTDFENYTKTDDFKKIQKTEREKEIKDSIRSAQEEKENQIRQREERAAERRDSIADAKRDKENAAYIVRMEKKYGKPAIKKAMDGGVWLGMTDELCLYGLTEPNRKKATYTKDGKKEVWIYQGQANGCIGNGCPYLDYVITFQNHKAIAITTGD